MRYSRQREAVMETLRHTDIHPNAEWVYREVKKTIKNISRGTVYRNLKELTESGEILMLSTGGASCNYDGDTSRHSHFVCRDCGRIKDLRLDSGLVPMLVGQGYRVDSEKLVFYGKCPDCAAGRAAGAVQ